MMKPILPLALLAALGRAPASAQTPVATTPASETTISPDDKKAFDETVALVRVAQLWQKPLDWNETGSTTADVATHIKKALGDGSPTIEVRSKDTSRSTFVLKIAPLGPTLSALADLANLKVWVFPNRLLLAPEAALSKTEQAAVREGMGGEWQSSFPARGSFWSPVAAMEAKGASLVALDLKAHLPLKPAPTAPPNNTPPKTEPSSSDQLSFDQLSPVAQEVLQQLFNQKNWQGLSQAPPSQLAPSTQVELNETNPNQLLLRLYTPKSEAPTERQEIARWSITKPSQTTQ